MVSLKKPCTGTAYIKNPNVSRCQLLMKEFWKKHEKTCNATRLDVGSEIKHTKKEFPTGSTYEGGWDFTGMTGHGTYTFGNGVIYEGHFLNGMMHGKGELRYDTPNGMSVLRGDWHYGIMTKKTLTFSDSLEYNHDFWKYCRMPDRRFTIEYNTELKPAGKSYLTAEQPTREIPPGLYDNGEGFYDPIQKVIYKYDLEKVSRAPAALEQTWILNNCRLGSEVPLGPRPDLYEKWSEPILHLAPPPPPAAGTRPKYSYFELDIDYENMPLFYDPSKSVQMTPRHGREFSVFE